MTPNHSYGSILTLYGTRGVNQFNRFFYMTALKFVGSDKFGQGVVETNASSLFVGKTKVAP